MLASQFYFTGHTGMIHGKILKKETDIILLVQDIATESWKETLGNCFLNISEFLTNSFNDSLYKLPFLLKRLLQVYIGRLREGIGRGG
jgi:hypothetical protein